MTQIWSQRHSVMHLEGKGIGRKTALLRAGIRMMSTVFKITQNTLRSFNLAEVLLMAAMNQLEAKRKALGNEVDQLKPYRAQAA